MQTGLQIAPLSLKRRLPKGKRNYSRSAPGPFAGPFSRQEEERHQQEEDAIEDAVQ